MSSEQRFVLFLSLSFLILIGAMALQNFLFPPPEPVAENVVDGQPGDGQPGEGQPADGQPGDGDRPEVADGDRPDVPADADDRVPSIGASAGDGDGSDGDGSDKQPGNDAEGAQGDGEGDPRRDDDQAPAEAPRPERRVTLGSMAPDAGGRMLVVFNTRGAAIEQLELVERKKNGKFRYSELFQRGGYVYSRSGYLGYLAVSDTRNGNGCRVNVVPPGSPADRASAPGVTGGLRAGDVIEGVAGVPVSDVAQLTEAMRRTKPRQSVELTVRRDDQVLSFDAQLEQYPLALIRPEDPQQLSFTVALADAKAIRNQRTTVPLARGMVHRNWEYDEQESKDLTDSTGRPWVVFHYPLSGAEAEEIGVTGTWRVTKRFALTPIAEGDQLNPDYPGYHLKMELEVQNAGSEPESMALRMDGPNGLPIEGWWYSNKTHPTSFSAVGARDVVWKTVEGSHQMIGCPAIHKWAKNNEKSPEKVLIDQDGGDQDGERPLAYVGVDTQYFACVLQSDEESGKPVKLSRMEAFPLQLAADISKYEVRKTNVSFRMTTRPTVVSPGQSYRQSYVIFAGPKRAELLQQYGLKSFIAYGWFWFVAIPLSMVLHTISWFVMNYGVAIILLTVIVRASMFPISRKAAKNAQMMQALAPEMKKIADKYKNDMEKRSQAQRELFAKHNYNPFGGCLLMFFQLPIFVGLYRSLAVDIELRDASLIPGIQWCSNLAGPDMFWFWEPYLLPILADPARGWLGPYLNILPLITIALFMVHQKLFMPPPTDDQTRMQQQMMKYMMIFMGVMFFKVPAGLCVYFVASSIWGIAERKLLPPPGKPGETPAPAKSVTKKKEAAAPASNPKTKRRKIKGRK